MKIVIILSIPFIMFASSDASYTGETLNQQEHRSIHGYNQKPTVKIKNKRKAHELHKVNEEQAKSIAREETKEEVISLKLIHTNKYLIYKVTTEHYSLKINALDGTVMQIQKK